MPRITKKQHNKMLWDKLAPEAKDSGCSEWKTREECKDVGFVGQIMVVHTEKEKCLDYIV